MNERFLGLYIGSYFLEIRSCMSYLLLLQFLPALLLWTLNMKLIIIIKKKLVHK